MDRDDSARERRLARRRELYRLHRAAETPEQREEGLAARRRVNTRAGDVQIIWLVMKGNVSYSEGEKATTMRRSSVHEVLFHFLTMPLLS